MWPFYRFGWSGDWSIFVLHPLLLSQSIMSYNGGAVMAMRGKNCVAIAADRRFGIQAQMVTTDFQKIFPMGDRLYIGLAGLATDVQTVWVGISSSQNVFFMPLFYLLCSESAHWFANFQLSFLKFEVKQNMLKEMMHHFSVSFPHVLFSSTCTQGVLTKWETLTLETNFFFLNDVKYMWYLAQLDHLSACCWCILWSHLNSLAAALPKGFVPAVSACTWE